MMTLERVENNREEIVSGMDFVLFFHSDVVHQVRFWAISLLMPFVDASYRAFVSNRNIQALNLF